MAFLRINGFTVPVAKLDEKEIEVGTRGYAENGSPLVHFRRIKRRWDGTTPPLERGVARAVRALLLGQGDVFHFDEGTGSTTFSSKGTETSGTTAWDTTTPKFGDAAGQPSSLTIPVSMINTFKDLTLNAWVKLVDAGSTNSIFKASYTVTPASRFELLRSGTNLSFATTDGAGGNADTLTTTSALSDWHMITCVMRTDPISGESIKELFFDGVSEDDSDPAGMPDLSIIDQIIMSYEEVDDLMLLPYAATAAQILAWFGMGKTMPDQPKCYVDGAGVIGPEFRALATGRITSVRRVQAAINGVWNNQLEQFGFTLEEV